MILGPQSCKNLNKCKHFCACAGFCVRMGICGFFFLIFISLPAYSAMTTKTYMERKTNVAGSGMATAGQIAKYVADGATGEMKLVGAAASDISSVLGAMSVSDILTGTDTTNELVSAQR